MSVVVYQNLNDGNPLAEELLRSYNEMSQQLQAAARFILAHPKDVALLSMREQAAKAGVSHSTMVRLAQFVGFERFEELRELYIDSIRHTGFASDGCDAGKQVSMGRVAECGEAIYAAAAQIMQLADEGRVAQLKAVARNMAAARGIICVGLDADHAAAHHFAFSLGSRMRAAMPPETDRDGMSMQRAKTGDIVFAVGLAPDCPETAGMLRRAAAAGATTVAIVGERASPLARLANASITVAEPFHGARCAGIAAIAVADVLAAMVAEKLKPDTRITLVDLRHEQNAVPIACERVPA
ncbi:MurR/RpiR family transcriptional regulator [Nitratireductor pacificus]|uniref:RpiR family transcriptional regulator n=1 Tax=Nitratireductor pacificus pht-3B TaxID=391937 RepID=K2LJ07_9HYPH|nr:MurR/RpiR family transcriptional regulator [Nitratireductor pacificus]EKF17674.1 RpiR family transcriptional regulator [Nitratireductor pacificus pht-3B]